MAAADAAASRKIVLGDVANRAYGRTLERHHPRLLRGIVRRAMFLLPRRDEL